MCSIGFLCSHVQIIKFFTNEAFFRTEWGKIATMVYALFGIPVYILYFMNMGKVDIIIDISSKIIFIIIVIIIILFIIIILLIIIIITITTAGICQHIQMGLPLGAQLYSTQKSSCKVWE